MLTNYDILYSLHFSYEIAYKLSELLSFYWYITSLHQEFSWRDTQSLKKLKYSLLSYETKHLIDDDNLGKLQLITCNGCKWLKRWVYKRNMTGKPSFQQKKRPFLLHIILPFRHAKLHAFWSTFLTSISYLHSLLTRNFDPKFRAELASRTVDLHYKPGVALEVLCNFEINPIPCYLAHRYLQKQPWWLNC